MLNVKYIHQIKLSYATVVTSGSRSQWLKNKEGSLVAYMTCPSHVNLEPSLVEQRLTGI